MNTKQSANLSRLWDNVLRRQVELTHRSDIDFFKKLSAWRKAKTVADLGAGPGHFLSAIAGQFPEKTYLAVDKNKLFLRRLKRQCESEVKTVCQDVQSDFTLGRKPVDFAIARLLVQHLPSLDGFFIGCSRAIKPGGQLLILDAEDRYLRFYPHLPTVDKALAQLANHLKRVGTGRNNWREIEKASHRHGFQKIRAVDFVYRAKDDKKAFYELFLNLGKLIRKAYPLQFGLVEFQRELQSWLENPNATGQCGVKALLLLRRPNDGSVSG